MSRAELALRVLSEDPIEGIVPKVNDGPMFAGRYPGGFAPLSPASEGCFVEFSPAGIAMVGEGLSEGQFLRLCEAIRQYQRSTLVSIGLQLPADLIVLKFIDDVPDDAAVLAATARRLRMTLVRFLGADRGTGVHS